MPPCASTRRMPAATTRARVGLLRRIGEAAGFPGGLRARPGRVRRDGGGPTPRITAVRPESAGYVVTADLGGTLEARTWVREAAGWRVVPSAGALANFGNGPAAWLADERAAGHSPRRTPPRPVGWQDGPQGLGRPALTHA